MNPDVTCSTKWYVLGKFRFLLLGPVLQVFLDILSSLNRFGKSLNVLQYLKN
jgi:hypothetical protein